MSKPHYYWVSWFIWQENFPSCFWFGVPASWMWFLLSCAIPFSVGKWYYLISDLAFYSPIVNVIYCKYHTVALMVYGIWMPGWAVNLIGSEVTEEWENCFAYWQIFVDRYVVGNCLTKKFHEQSLLMLKGLRAWNLPTSLLWMLEL